MQVILAQPRGFCAGVERAIEIVEEALKLYGPPIYVRHEIVHNPRVVEDLRSRGARFVDEVDEIPEGAIAVFSAHGVAQRVERAAAGRSLQVLDATCPLVTKVHAEGRHYAAAGYDVVLIGRPGHAEIEGTMGQIPGPVLLVSSARDVERLAVRNPDKVAYITQTTLSVDDTRETIRALRRRFPNVVGPDVADICYATQNRQSAVRELVSLVDLVLVVGARNSNNSVRLREVAAGTGTPAYLVQQPTDIDPAWLQGKRSVGITAGASTPEALVQEVVAKLRDYADIDVSTMDGIVENVQFSLPAELQPVAAAS